MSPPTDVAVPNEEERRQIFYALKRWTSYSAWHRILSFYQDWEAIAESSLREANDAGLDLKTSLGESIYVGILKGLASCDDGVRRLRSGDKRVFKSDSDGDFAMARRGALDHWSFKQMYIERGDIVPNVGSTPRWHEFMTALQALEEAWSECARHALQPSPEDGPDSATFLNDFLRTELNRIPFPNPLSEVPDPTPDVLKKTGQELPLSGIWEPISVPTRSVFSLFAAAAPVGPFPVVGTMSYLHGGTTAPPMASYGKLNGESTTWRLLWRDDRYIDGSIPEEERQYVFLKPELQRPPPPDAVSGLLVATTGTLAPRGGIWAAKDVLTARTEVKAGDQLPRHDGRDVEWVFVSDA